MSLASKVTLCAATAASIGIISGVHWKHKHDQKAMKQGVLRDLEKVQKKQQQLSLQPTAEETSPLGTSRTMKENG